MRDSWSCDGLAKRSLKERRRRLEGEGDGEEGRRKKKERNTACRLRETEDRGVRGMQC